jgi:hypothetical protein
MNLDHYVQRIESFLSATETGPETWTRLAKIMQSYTGKLWTRSSPFENCSTMEGFCEACTKTADKVCGMAAFFFDFKYRECLAECAKQKASLSIDSLENKDQVERAHKELEKIVEERLAKLGSEICQLTYNVENAFHLYYYADMIRTTSDANEQQTHAQNLCRKQEAYAAVRLALKTATPADVKNAVRIATATETLLPPAKSNYIITQTEILDRVPGFKKHVSELKDDAPLKSFLLYCIALQWNTIRNYELADHALCSIQTRSASTLNPPPIQAEMPHLATFVAAVNVTKAAKDLGEGVAGIVIGIPCGFALIFGLAMWKSVTYLVCEDP